MKKLDQKQLDVVLDHYKTISYKDLNSGDYMFLRDNGIMNGCGGAGDKVQQRFIRWILKWAISRLRIVFVEASCDIHDFTYWQGGDEAQRKKCDLGFFSRIISDIGSADISGVGVIRYTLIALIFYYAVRLGGKQYFSYK